MKKLNLYLAAVVFMVMQSLTTLADDRIIPVEQLPVAAKSFIEKNFSNTDIAYATKDVDFVGATFEATLNDGTEIDFDNTGNWIKVDCEYNAVPAAIVPAVIAQHVKTNFSRAIITKIEKNRRGYEVELSNGLDLRFNKKGQFTGIDD